MKLRRILLAAGVVGVLAACTGPAPSSTAEVRVDRAAKVAPELVSGNPTCVGLGYTYGFKPNAGGAENTAGTFPVVIGGINTGVTITWSYQSGSSSTINWSATILDPVTNTTQPFGLDAVIVKGGNAANVYKYSPEASSDTGLVTPVNASGSPAAVSHVEFCFDFDVLVSKTAVTSYDRDWAWSIDKTSTTSALTLSGGQTQLVNYSVTLDTTKTDSNFAVSGTITIFNPDPFKAATITSVTDTMTGGLNATVNCSLPLVIPSKGTATCSYSRALDNSDARTNTATVTTEGPVGGGVGTAPVVFGNPTNETDECVSVDDDKYSGNLGDVCAADAPKTLNYSMNVGPYTCTAVEQKIAFINTASFTTKDSGKTGSDGHTVTVTVPACAVGCTLTQGYWKTHSDRGPAPYDDAWKNLGSLEEDTLFFKSGRTWYTVFWTAPAGNPFYILAHQYMAAKLNVLNGAATTASVTAALTGAETLFNSLAAGSTTLSATQRKDALAWAATLDQYNNGLIGPGHCSE